MAKCEFDPTLARSASLKILFVYHVFSAAENRILLCGIHHQLSLRFIKSLVSEEFRIFWTCLDLNF